MGDYPQSVGNRISAGKNQADGWRRREYQRIGIQRNGTTANGSQSDGANVPGVTQKAFDDFHLDDILNRTVSLRDGERSRYSLWTLRMSACAATISTTVPPSKYSLINAGHAYQNQATLVLVARIPGLICREIKNTETNHLGMPLPVVGVRLYRRDADGQVEFVGENLIGHTPAEEMVGVPICKRFRREGSRRQPTFTWNTTSACSRNF